MIRILLVDDDSAVRGAIRGMIDQETDMTVVAEQDSLGGIMDSLRRYRPHILLLDINLPDGNGLSVVPDVVASFPATGVIMISVQKDVDFLREAMRAGAKDYITKPFQPEDLAKTVRAVFGAAKQGGLRETRIIGVWSCRGGAGGTAFSLSLADALGCSDKDVAVIDGDLSFGDAAFYLDARPELTWVDWAREAGGDRSAGIRFLTRTPTLPFGILAAPRNPAQAELIKPGMGTSFLRSVEQRLDYIVIDLPRSLSDTVLELAEACHALWLLTDLSCSGIKNLRLLRTLLDQLRFPNDECAVVVNRVEKRNKGDLERIRAEYSLRGLLPLDESVEQAWTRGMTPLRAFPKSPYSREILRIAAGCLSGAGAS